MKDSSKQKPPERSLIGPMVLCFFGGFVLLGVPALIYLQGRDSLQASPLLSSVPVRTYDTVADLAHYLMFGFLPLIGFCFLCIGYLILRAYRKIKFAEKQDHADA